MSRDMLPDVRLSIEVDSQRHRIVSYLTEREIDLPKMVSEAIDAELAGPALAEQIHRQIKAQIENVLREEIRSIVSRAFWSPEMKARIANTVLDAMQEPDAT